MTTDDAAFPIGIGVIGLGFGRFVHVPGFRYLPDVRVIGVASQSIGSWRELIASPEIHGVSIATPPSSHKEIACAAFAAGKAVLCEKPLAAELSDATEMHNCAQRSGVAHMVNFEFRELPAWRMARSLILEGAIGSVRSVKIDWIVSTWADPKRPWSWKCDRALGGGILSALGAHVFDYIEWFWGPIRSIKARLSIGIPERTDTAGIKHSVTGADCCEFLIELDGRVPVAGSLSNVAPYTKGHSIEVHGEKKTLILSSTTDDYGKGFRLQVGNGSKFEDVTPPDDSGNDGDDGRIQPFLGIARRFIHAIRAGCTNERPSFLDGLRAQIIMDACMKSDKENCVIQIPVTAAS